MATLEAERVEAAPLETVVTLRKKNQLTLPESLVRRLGVGEGDRLVFEFDEQSGELRMRPLLKSYAGLLNGVYGSAEEKAAYLEEERRSWGA
jgi:bifunctional DNA-binding transcriptional regulator/antitoxin component of YhaV-PrlF toxin-antitoxin module